MSDFIVTWDKYFGERNEQEREMVIRARLLKKGIQLPSVLTINEKASHVLPFVNDGRWLVRCPDCQTAHFAREDELLMCNNCGNVKIGKENRLAPFPKNRKQIEEILLLRPRPTMRHWTVETLAELRKENREHGHLVGREA